MRTLWGLAVAGGLVAGIASASAAPINFTPIPPGALESQSNLAQKAWWNRYGQWCSRRCNHRRCWVVCR
jgi:hypothetical protein